MSESSPAACRLAILDRTDFCFLLTALLNIDSALTLISFAGRDDSDGFFFAIFILRARYVNNQQHSRLWAPIACHRCSPVTMRSLRKITWGSSKTSAALSKAMPPCFCWLIQFFSLSHSNPIAIQNV